MIKFSYALSFLDCYIFGAFEFKFTHLHLEWARLAVQTLLLTSQSLYTDFPSDKLDLCTRQEPIRKGLFDSG